MIRIKGFSASPEKVSALNAITAKLAAKDATLWGPAAQAEAAIRLNWIDLPLTSRELLPTLDALSAWSREIGHSDFVLCGMGGSSLAPEVIAAVYKKNLTVLDSTDPEHVKVVLDRDLSKTCFVVGSKSGSTIETASQKSAAEAQLLRQGLDPKNHLVVVTDPGSPLDKESRAAGLRVINADPNVGGRFSALSAFGLTPAALIGVDVSVLIDDAFEAAQSFLLPNSTVVSVAAALAEPTFAYTGFCDAGSTLPGLSDWIEQLIAESTGKDEKGVLPIVTSSPKSEIFPVISFDEQGEFAVTGSLGEQFIFWEWVTALLGYLMKVDPFNQPNVTEAKEKTGALLDRWKGKGVQNPEPAFNTSAIAVFSDSTAHSLTDYLRSAITHPNGYIALMAYLHRGVDNEVMQLRELLEKAGKKPVTFGWGPRFLHSTGQFHKGGPKVGSFIQITGATQVQWPIRGRDYGFEVLVMAQALGDNEALAARNYPLVRFHLKERSAGIQELIAAAKEL
jgi:glucose-6-phosphate isomerase